MRSRVRYRGHRRRDRRRGNDHSPAAGRAQVSASSRSSSWPRAARPARRFASPASDYTVEELTPAAFDGVDLAIGSTPDEVARDFAPWAVERGCVVVDESGYWRMDPKVPLVIPEVNPDAVDQHQGIIASPNCSTTQMVVALKPLHDAARVRRVVVSTYQATSGTGLAGSRDLDAVDPRGARRRAVQAARPSPITIAFNLIPQIGSPKEQGYTSEEMKMVYETRKILGDESIQICPTCVRVPVEQLPQREHSGRDRAEAHRRGGPQAVRRHAGHRRGRRSGGQELSDAARTATAATRCSSAAFARTCPAPTAWPSGA